MATNGGGSVLPFTKVYDAGGTRAVVRCVSLDAVPAECIAEAYADLQSRNPLIRAFGLSRADRARYGLFLARRGCPRASSVAVADGDAAARPRVLGVSLGMRGEQFAADCSELPPSAAAHWAFCRNLAGACTIYGIFAGVVPELRKTGLLSALHAANRALTMGTDVTHNWGFQLSQEAAAREPGVTPAAAAQLPAGISGVRAVAGALSLVQLPIVWRERRVLVWAYPCADFQWDGSRPLDALQKWAAMVTVATLRHRSGCEKRSRL
eukprot:TRINITY_DN14191_c0_g1_i2.p1 TRINITY_DN14191_c0_g1~~TRINITY_DN14191_c0_g1_i2.p1  ORF type:complete len:266 (+),score=33.37 TRINITY_DN14191_c0_g1_i2:64-861(+)